MHGVMANGWGGTMGILTVSGEGGRWVVVICLLLAPEFIGLGI